jgi:hypothetical protein
MTTKAAAARKALRQAFKAAKIYLARNAADLDNYQQPNEEFICCSLDRASLEGHISAKSLEASQALVMDRISPYVTACQWLAGTLKVDMMKLDEDDVQEWRHRWLDELIKEFSK